MDPKSQQKIIRGHGHLISSSSFPNHVSNPTGSPSVEDSGPPSPSSGPIINFAEVSPGIYRSSFPRSGNFEHMKSLGLKSILYVSLDPSFFPLSFRRAPPQPFQNFLLVLYHHEKGYS